MIFEDDAKVSEENNAVARGLGEAARTALGNVRNETRAIPAAEEGFGTMVRDMNVSEDTAVHSVNRLYAETHHCYTHAQDCCGSAVELDESGWEVSEFG